MGSNGPAWTRFPPEAAGQHLHELAGDDDVLHAFLHKRAEHPTGQETIQGLTSRIVAYSLHVGEHRGITWHQEEFDIVWLLAARFHRSGDPNDAYPHFLSLDAAGALLPTSEDAGLNVKLQTRDFARALIEEVPVVVSHVRGDPGVPYPFTLGGRIQMRAIWEDDDPPMLTIALSHRLQPGELQLPVEWQIVVAAAFFPDADPNNLSYAWDLADSPLQQDEIAFCDFIPRT